VHRAICEERHLAQVEEASIDAEFGYTKEVAGYLEIEDGWIV
jgi:hypothetical protein